MEINDVASLISSIGFPIAMCLILFRYINTTQKELIEKLGDISRDIGILCERVSRNDEN